MGPAAAARAQFDNLTLTRSEYATRGFCVTSRSSVSHGDASTASASAQPLVADLVLVEPELLERGRRAAREGVGQVAQPLVADLVLCGLRRAIAAGEVERLERLERPLSGRVLERRGKPARLLVAPAEPAEVQLLRVRESRDEEGAVEQLLGAAAVYHHGLHRLLGGVARG